MSDDYEVGYGKPPKQTQFHKGRSGNSNGRPKASTTTTKKAASVLKEILNKKITVKEGGTTRRITKMEALLETLLNDALRGDKTARRLFVTMARETGELEVPPENKMRAGGVLLVPMAESREEWEKKAFEQQRKYREAPIPDVKKPNLNDPKKLN